VQTADVVTLFRAAEDPRLECFLVLAYMSGCVKEVLGLTTAMIEGNHVHLRAQLGRKANPDFDPSRLPDPRTNPKSVSALLPWLKRSSRQRTLVLNDELMRIVMRSIDLAKETEIPTEVGSIRATPVVPNQQGRFWQVQDFRLAWNAMCTRAGVRITPHQFRALLTREERKRGVAFDQIAAWLGHSGPDTTIRSYHRYEEGEIPMLDPMVERANRLSNELTKGS
jgi:integrase